MSAKLVGEVFDRYPGVGGEFTLALALADRAHDDGTHVFLSVDSLAQKTRQSERSVQYQLRAMEKAGWLILVREASRALGLAREYRINPEWIGERKLYRPAKDKSPGAMVAPGVSGNQRQPAAPPSSLSPGATIAPGSMPSQGCAQAVEKPPEPGATIAPHASGAGCNLEQKPGAKALHPRQKLNQKIGGEASPAAAQPRQQPVALLASAAWAEVSNALRRGEKPPAWSSPVVDQVLRELGGFHHLGQKTSREIEFVGNDFKAIFKLRALQGAMA